MKNRIIILSLFALGCFALCSVGQAVIPAPDGGYPGFNTAEGDKALFSLTTGSGNTAVGWFSLFANAENSFNTGVGAGTLLFNTADANTAVGTAALLFNTTGFNNTALGAAALLDNTEGNSNTATGAFALHDNTTGNGNTANGSQALQGNSEGSLNTAVGAATLISNTIGNDNTGVGLNALFSNTEGNNNTAVGRAAMGGNTTGENNTAVGWFALEQGGVLNTAIGSEALRNSTSAANTAVGAQALINATTGGPFGIQANTAVGDSALGNCTTGFWNTAIGYTAGLNQTDGDRNVYIGQGVGGVAGESDACYIASIYGQAPGPNDLAVHIGDNGKLGTVLSSRRFKHDIKPMDKTSEAILALKPVTFHYNSDKRGTSQFGLIAEEVAEVNPDLIVRDKEGKPYSVRYDQVNAMLLNEFLKEHRKVEELQATVAQQQKGMEVLTAQLKEQAAQIQKVSAQIEVSKPAPQVVMNRP